jgi:4-hydroxy-tetrahydrodipicolinate reductase
MASDIIRRMAIRVMHFGLGPIGAAVVQQVATRRGFKVVGGIDIDPAKVGKDLGAVTGLTTKLGVKVTADAPKAIRAAKPDVVVLCTSSSLKKVWPQMEEVLKLKVPIVSTTEELAYPAYSHKALAARIDKAARKAKVAVLGTGVNPGFTMDALPITLTGVCANVEAITVNRIQDARSRRLPFQQKIGCGLTPAQFQARVDAGTVRHVGLTESIAMIADAMGWTLDRVTDQIRPQVAAAAIASQFLTVQWAGQVCGLIQDGIGYVKGQPAIRLHMERVSGRARSRTPWRSSAAQPVDEDRRRRAWRHRHGVDHRELNREGAGGAAGVAHHAQPAFPSWFGG